MKKNIFTTLVTLMVIPSICMAHNFAILVETEYVKVRSLCSRPGIKATAGWSLTEEVVLAIERDAPKLNEFDYMNDEYILSDYYKQYFGVIVNEKKYIYVNAFRSWRFAWLATEFVDLCDGGLKSYRALYDPVTGSFSEFEDGGF